MQPMTLNAHLVRTEATHHVVNSSKDVILFQGGKGDVHVWFLSSRSRFRPYSGMSDSGTEKPARPKRSNSATRTQVRNKEDEGLAKNTHDRKLFSSSLRPTVVQTKYLPVSVAACTR